MNTSRFTRHFFHASAALIVALLCIVSNNLLGQTTTGNIRGYVTGANGAPLSDAQVIMRKVEDWNDIKPEYDLLTTRALKQEVIFEAAPRVLSPAGRILLYRAKPLELVPATCKIVKELSFTLPFDGSSRTLTLLRLITP